MSDYISREAARKAVCDGCNVEFPDEGCEPVNCSILERLGDVPSADVAPVVHSKWFELVDHVEDGHTGEYYEEVYYNCLNCDFATTENTPFCPNCGARMDAEVEE